MSSSLEESVSAVLAPKPDTYYDRTPTSFVYNNKTYRQKANIAGRFCECERGRLEPGHVPHPLITCSSAPADTACSSTLPDAHRSHNRRWGGRMVARACDTEWRDRFSAHVPGESPPEFTRRMARAQDYGEHNDTVSAETEVKPPKGTVCSAYKVAKEKFLEASVKQDEFEMTEEKLDHCKAFLDRTEEMGPWDWFSYDSDDSDRVSEEDCVCVESMRMLLYFSNLLSEVKHDDILWA